MKSWRTILLAGAYACACTTVIADPTINTNDGDLAVRSEVFVINPDPNPVVIGVPVGSRVSAATPRPESFHGYAAQTGAWALFFTGIGGVAWFAWRNLQIGKRDTRWKKRHARWLPF